MATTPRGLNSPTRPRGIDWPAELPYLLLLVVVYAGLEVVLRMLAGAGAFEGLQTWTAAAVQSLLATFGVRAVLAGFALVTARGTVSVAGLCLPVTPLALGVALIVAATPVSLARKGVLLGVLAGALFIASIVRIAVVTALVNSGSPMMSAMHETISPIALAAVALGVWFLGLGMARSG